MKTKEIGVQGFRAIYYKGKPISHDTVTSTENVIVACNRLHAHYLRWRYRKTGLRVVVERWLDYRDV